MDLHDEDAVIYQSLSILSTIMSGTVVVTGFVFPAMTLNPKRIFSHILFFISFYDMVGSIGNSFGYPLAGTQMCTAQSVLFLFAFPASWIWTTFMVYQLRCVMIYNRVWLSVVTMHIVAVTVALLLLLLPLSTNEYGQDDDYSGEGPCNFSGPLSSALDWLAVSFTTLLSCLIVMILCMADVARHYRTTGQPMTRNISSLYNGTRLYPMGMAISWFPSVVYFWFEYAGIPVAAQIAETCFFLQTQYGTILALIFFVYSTEARDRWARLLKVKVTEQRHSSVEVHSWQSDIEEHTSESTLYRGSLFDDQWGSGLDFSVATVTNTTKSSVVDTLRESLLLPTTPTSTSKAQQCGIDGVDAWGLQMRTSDARSSTSEVAIPVVALHVQQTGHHSAGRNNRSAMESTVVEALEEVDEEKEEDGEEVEEIKTSDALSVSESKCGD